MTDATWLLRLDAPGDGPRLAVKDCIDVAGTPTTSGSAAVAADAAPAQFDAPVVESARSQGARIVGKTNLVELCRHADGVNPWSGTPHNPLDPERIPGGSSSGSAVALADDEADVAYGTDTGGSIRVPAACCGIAGLKTTRDRLSTNGILEFSRTLDTVGPMARDIAGLVLGMQLMEPGFAAAASYDGPPTIARLRFPDVEPGIDDAIDQALAATELRPVDVSIPEWESWIAAANDIMGAEGYLAQRNVLGRSQLLEPRHLRDIEEGRDIPAAHVTACRRVGEAARVTVQAVLDQHGAIALPTLRMLPPRLGEKGSTTYLTVPFNLVGTPAVALPVPRSDHAIPASLQLVGRWHDEERLLALAARVEAAVAAG